MVHRNTVQRELVLDAVRSLKCHATAEEVYAYIIKEHPSVGKATIYRNLNILAEEGMIQRIETVGGADRYDHLTIRHQHVRCEKCGKYFDVLMKNMPDLIGCVEDSCGAEIEDYEIVFRGICPDCRIKEKQ